MLVKNFLVSYSLHFYLMKSQIHLRTRTKQYQNWRTSFNLLIDNARNFRVHTEEDVITITFDKDSLDEKSKVEFNSIEENEKNNNARKIKYEENLLTQRQLKEYENFDYTDFEASKEDLTEMFDFNHDLAFFEEEKDEHLFKERKEQLCLRYIPKETTELRDDPGVPKWIPKAPTCAMRFHVQGIENSINFVGNYYLDPIKDMLGNVIKELKDTHGIIPGQHTHLKMGNMELLDGNEEYSPYELSLPEIMDLDYYWDE